MKKKSFAYIFRRKDRDLELLVFRFKHVDYQYYRLPGGGLKSGETYYEACLRELAEEAGVKAVTPVQDLDRIQYYKPYIDAHVARQDYVFLISGETCDQWEWSVGGKDKDAGEVFIYSWITPENFFQVCPELRGRLMSDEIKLLRGYKMYKFK